LQTPLWCKSLHVETLRSGPATARAAVAGRTMPPWRLRGPAPGGRGAALSGLRGPKSRLATAEQALGSMARCVRSIQQEQPKPPTPGRRRAFVRVAGNLGSVPGPSTRGKSERKVSARLDLRNPPRGGRNSAGARGTNRASRRCVSEDGRLSGKPGPAGASREDGRGGLRAETPQELAHV